MDFSKELSSKVERINSIISEYMPAVEGYQETIFSAMNYSVSAGGKRLRPMIMEESFRLFSGTGDAIYPFMAAIEMIHTYSLVHDDLPAMDDDDYRRGKETTHKVYGEAMGVLAGDALLNYAMETALKAFDADPANANIPRALKVLFTKSGIYGMIGGQVVDVESEKKGLTITKDKLDFIHKLKTAALIEASAMVGAILAGASEDEIAAMEKIATGIGLAFQIQDDILDVTSTLEVLGKPVGSDEKNEKVTYVTYEGIDKSREDVARYSDEAMAILAGLDRDDEFLQELFKYLIHREN